MDYTNDQNLMRILSELADEVKGWQYSIKSSNWKDNEVVIASRRKTLNDSIVKFERHINAKKE